MHSFEIQQQLNFSEIYWLTMYRAQLKGKKLRILLIAIPVLTGLLSGIIQNLTTLGRYKNISPIFFGLVIISYVITFIYKFNKNKNQQPYKLLVQPDRIECVSKKGISRINWSEINYYIEFPNHLLLFLSDVSGNTITTLIQKNTFITNSDTDLLLSLRKHGVQKR